MKGLCVFIKSAIFLRFCLSEYKFKKLILRSHTSKSRVKTDAKKCGFELEGIKRKDYKTTAGIIVDFIYYVKTKQHSNVGSMGFHIQGLQ